MSELFTAENMIALLTLTSLEIVLGIDNIVFIAIISAKLEPALQPRARKVGLALAMFGRIALLFGIVWIMKLTKPMFSLFDHEFSGKDLILLAGGLFLIAKATSEIHDKMEGPKDGASKTKAAATFRGAIVQILIIDLVFSLDSVITAVGMADVLAIMVAAVVAAVGVMLVFADKVSRFIEQHPTVKVLALSFLLLIGVMLVAEGMGKAVEKGYIYFALAFSLGVEMVNLRVRKTDDGRPSGA